MFKKALLILALLLLASCGDKKDNADKKVPPATKTNAANVLKEAKKFFTLKEIEDSISVSEARKLKVGDEVTLTGDVIGVKSPFAEGRASFIIGDPGKITACDLIDDDNCKIPWDCCCNTPEDRANATLSIQLLDTEGNILKTSVKGINDLVESDAVVIKGTVAEGSSDTNMIINAELIWVEK